MSIGGTAPRPVVVDVTVVVGLLLVITYVLTGFPLTSDYDQLLSRGVFPDVIHERATAWEAIWGDPYRPLSEIMPEHGHEGRGADVAPRPPSALLVQTPLVLISSEALMPAGLLMTLILLIWIGWLIQTVSGVEPSKLLLAAPVVMVSLPVVSTISYSPVSAVFTVALILTAWRFQDRRWAGVLLGIATGLRLWPGLVIIGFWLAGKRRLAVMALATFAVLNVMAILLLPRVDLGSSISSLTNATDDWLNSNVNSSLALVLWPYGVPPLLATVLVAATGVLASLKYRDNAVPITIVAALIASPLSWPTYALAALPIAALCVRRLPRAAILVISVPFALWSLLPSKWVGHAHFLALALLFVLLVSRPGLVASPPLNMGSEPSESVVT